MQQYNITVNYKGQRRTGSFIATTQKEAETQALIYYGKKWHATWGLVVVVHSLPVPLPLLQNVSLGDLLHYYPNPPLPVLAAHLLDRNSAELLLRTCLLFELGHTQEAWEEYQLDSQGLGESITYGQFCDLMPELLAHYNHTTNTHV